MVVAVAKVRHPDNAVTPTTVMVDRCTAISDCRSFGALGGAVMNYLGEMIVITILGLLATAVTLPWLA